QVQKQLDQIEQRSYQISYLVHNLVGLSQDTVPHFSPVDLTALIDELEQAWDVTNGKIPRFAINKSGDLPAVLGNRVLLSSVLHNLMRIFSTLAGPDTVPRLQVTHIESENNVKISIANGTPGLSDDEIEQLLDLFYRGSKISPGTGLALFISKRVVELHGCHLEIRNDEDLGTVFEILLQASGPATL
ncbi:MAG: sensor histidine kinase, partial [Calditrichaeota bacterium]